MKTWWVVLSLTWAWATALGAGSGDVAKVTFQDGVTVDVDDWEFVYECGIPLTGEYYRAETKRTKDLILNLGQRKEHGVTLTNTRTISRPDLVSIRYDWPMNSYYISTNATVALADGALLHSVKLEPPVECLSATRRAFFKALRLEGTVTRDNIRWPFSADLRMRGSEASETVISVEFAAPEQNTPVEQKPAADLPDVSAPMP